MLGQNVMREKMRSKNMDPAALTNFTEHLCLKSLGQHPNKRIIQTYPSYVKLLWGNWAFYTRAVPFLIFLTELLAVDKIGNTMCSEYVKLATLNYNTRMRLWKLKTPYASALHFGSANLAVFINPLTENTFMLCVKTLSDV